MKKAKTISKLKKEKALLNQPVPPPQKENSSNLPPDTGFLSIRDSWDGFLESDYVLNNPHNEAWRKRLIRTMLHEGASGEMLEVMEFSMKYKLYRKSIL